MIEFKFSPAARLELQEWRKHVWEYDHLFNMKYEYNIYPSLEELDPQKYPNLIKEMEEFK